MDKLMNSKALGLISFGIALLLCVATPAWSAQFRAKAVDERAGTSKARAEAAAGQTRAQLSAKYAGKAVEKTGFYKEIANDRVSILDEKSYRKLTYMVGKDMIVTIVTQGPEQEQELVQEIEPGALLPHSIVKLIIVDAEVVEIVLLQESS